MTSLLLAGLCLSSALCLLALVIWLAVLLRAPVHGCLVVFWGGLSSK